MSNDARYPGQLPQRPDNDADILRVVAEWLDGLDNAFDIVDDHAIQDDLRRIAKRLDGIDSLNLHWT